MDEDATTALRNARELLDVYRERDEALCDVRVLLHLLAERNRQIRALQQHIDWLRRR